MSASSPDRSQQRQLGELMSELGMITREQLAVALEAQRESGRALGQIIVEMGFASGAAVAHALAIQSGGALRTEYGYALGLPSRAAARGADGDERAAERDEGRHAMKIPKLRLVEAASNAASRMESQPADSPTQEEPEPERAEWRTLARGDLAEQARPPANVPPDIETPEEPAAWSEIADAEDSTPPLEERRDPLASEVARERDAAREALEEAATARDRAVSDLADARKALGEARERLAESTVTARERDRARAEVERLQRVLTELRTAGAEELAAVSEKRDRLAARLGETQEALNRALERLAAADSAAAERDGALAEIERLQAALAEARSQAEEAAHAEERTRLAAGLGETQEALREALDRLAAAEEVAGQRSSAVAEVERLQAALAEAQADRTAGAAAAAEERERLATELAETKQALAEAELRARAVSGLEAERDGALAQVERLHILLGRSQAQHATKDAAAEEERERLAIGLAETQQALREALERLTAAEVEASEHGRAAIELAAERDRLTQDLGDAERALRKARKRLTAASQAIAARDRARAEVERLQAVVDNWHRWAAQAPVVDQARHQAVADPEEKRDHAGVNAPEPLEQVPAVGERGDYVLLIPSSNGYALAQRAGTPPGAGDVIELPDPETHEISRFTVARVGRSPLPDGGICVYLLSD